MFDIISPMKKQVLIRGVDEDIYRRAKAVAALLGNPMGSAVEMALNAWTAQAEGASSEKELTDNIAFVRNDWDKIRRHRGKVAVVALRKLQGLFNTYEEARSFSSRFRIALTFTVQNAPVRREVEFGPEMEIR